MAELRPQTGLPYVLHYAVYGITHWQPSGRRRRPRRVDKRYVLESLSEREKTVRWKQVLERRDIQVHRDERLWHYNVYEKAE